MSIAEITHGIGNASRFISHLMGLVLLLTLAACTPATTSGAPLAEANRLYEAGQFAEATAAYQALVDTGVMSGIAYYNLGNAYFKIGDVGRAILNYRRAQQLLPRDADVADNLRLAQAQTQDRLDADDGKGLARWIGRMLTGWLTLNEAAVVALVLWAWLCTLVTLALLRPRYRSVLRYGIAGAVMILALSVLSIGLRTWEIQRVPAIIVADSVEIFSGPGLDYITEFTLHAGAEVRVIEARDGWMRIALPGDLQGWGPADAMVTVF